MDERFDYSILMDLSSCIVSDFFVFLLQLFCNHSFCFLFDLVIMMFPILAVFFLLKIVFVVQVGN